MVALLVLAGLIAGSGVALAQDPGVSEPAVAEPSDASTPAEKAGDSAVDTAIREVPTSTPTYRGDLLYPRFSDESPHEAFMRLAEDFLYISEIGGNDYAGRVPLWPRGSIKLGPFQVFPYLTGSLSWTDNVFQDDRKRSSWYWTVGAGFTGQANFAGGRGSLGFGVSYRYSDYLQQDDIDFDEWVANLHVGYAFPFGLWFKAGVKYEDLTRPVGSDYTDFSPRRNFVPFVDIGFANAFGNKINIEFGVQGSFVNFDKDAYETGNRRVASLWAKVSYPFIKESSRVYLRYTYRWDRRPSSFQNRLKNGHEIVGGIEGAIPIGRTEKLVGFLEVGYQNANFANQSTVREGIVTDDKSDNGAGVLRARLRYRMGPRTSMDASVTKSMDFSTRGNYQNRWYGDYNVNYNLLRGMILRGSAYLEWSKASGDNTTVTRFGFGLGTRYLLTDNLDVFTDINWNRRNTIREGWHTSWFIWTLGVTVYLQ